MAMSWSINDYKYVASVISIIVNLSAEKIVNVQLLLYDAIGFI